MDKCLMDKYEEIKSRRKEHMDYGVKGMKWGEHKEQSGGADKWRSQFDKVLSGGDKEINDFIESMGNDDNITNEEYFELYDEIMKKYKAKHPVY